MSWGTRRRSRPHRSPTWTGSRRTGSMGSSTRSHRGSSPGATRATSRCSGTIRKRSHRVAVVLRGRGLSPEVTDTDPHEAGEAILESEARKPEAKATAKAVNAFTKQAYKVLKDHPVNRARVAKGEPPANTVVLRGAGVYPDLVPITERLHLKAVGIAGVALIRGMFRTVGMDVVEVP